MQLFIRALFSGLAILAMLTPIQAHATLIGDEVACDFSLTTPFEDPAGPCSTTMNSQSSFNAVVNDAGAGSPEFYVGGFAAALQRHISVFSVDLGADFIQVDYLLTFLAGGTLDLELTSLDWGSPIAGVETTLSGLAMHEVGVSFTSTSVTINVDTRLAPPGMRVFVRLLDGPVTPVAAPGLIPLLLPGFVLLAARRRRQRTGGLSPVTTC